MEEIQQRIVKQGERGGISRLLYARNDEEKIAAWRSDLNRILQVFNVRPITSVWSLPTVHFQTELTINTNATVSNTHSTDSDIHHTIVNGQGGSGGANRSVSDTGALSVTGSPLTSRRLDSNQVSDLNCQWTHHLTFKPRTLGESPPPPSRTFFGRNKLIEEIVGLAENLTPIALIGAGGIGKTSIALAILHHDQIKHRFGDNRRFIPCDQFPASPAHFLRRLSDAIGAGIENPKNLTALRTFLSAREMLIVLDNAESILGLPGTNGREIYAVVEELGRFSNIWMCITSRISTIPPDYKRLTVPVLSMDAARDTFYRIYGGDDRSRVVNRILEQLDFHPLSITLLATVAHQNQWDTNQLARQWEQRRTRILQTQHNTSLALAIEVSLASPMFRELGPHARELLGVVAFLPQGIVENNLCWLFPTIPNQTDIFDKFRILSLTYRNNGFITMLAPLRDYLFPKHPMSSPLLCTAKERYFLRISVHINPNRPSFRESQWIKSEDMNVEHLLDVFTTIDANSDSIWDICAKFMDHLYWHKPRLTILKPKIEGLPDDHRSKPECLYEFSRLFHSIGNNMESKRFLNHALKLSRERGDDYWVAKILWRLSGANRVMGLPEEGMRQAREALDIFERLDDTVQQVNCLITLAMLLQSDKQLDAAEEAVSRAIDLLSETDDQFLLCDSHQALGNIYRSKGETGKAIHHFQVALGIASSFGWHDFLFWTNHSLAWLFLDKGRFDDAQAHVDRAKSHAVGGVHKLGRAMELQAWVWYKQHRLEEARYEALRAADIYERLGATTDLKWCRGLLQRIEEELNRPLRSGQSGSSCKFLRILRSPACINFPFQARGTKIWRRLFR